jgi:GNAT superfamily N-acetyltransferase
MSMIVRPITFEDAGVLAHLHASSWRSAYRGLFSDTFLDDGVDAERRGVWTERMETLSSSEFGFIADVDGAPAGFIFVRAAHDRDWGTMLDNLHVLEPFRSHGVGRRLIATGMQALIEGGHREPVWLWVFEPNTAARRVYARLGGHEAERAVERAPDGAERAKWRVVWDGPETLLANTHSRG